MSSRKVNKNEITNEKGGWLDVKNNNNGKKLVLLL